MTYFQVCLDTHYWTAVNQFFVGASVIAYFAITFTIYSDEMYFVFTSTFPFVGENTQLSCCELHCAKLFCLHRLRFFFFSLKVKQRKQNMRKPAYLQMLISYVFTPTSTLSFTSGTARNSLRQPNVWLTMLLTCLLCVLPVLTLRFLRILLRPTISDRVREHRTH